jgi:hypothetical protein
VPRAGIGREDRLGELVSVRQDHPRGPLLDERPDEAGIGALDDLGDPAGVDGLAVALALAGDLGADDVAVDRPRRFRPGGMYRSSRVPGSVGTTNPKPRLLCRYGPDELIPRRPGRLGLVRHHHRAAAAKHDPPGVHEVAQCFPERR